MALPDFYIYIPPKFWPPVIPTDPDQNWRGFGLGMYTWTIQTYLRLRADGFPCQLVDRLPHQGVILADHNHLRATRPRPSPRQLLVCLKQDGLPYPYAQYHVSQNPEDAKNKACYHYIPHWPQPGLIGRDARRGDRFENVAFFGHRSNLALELQQPSWRQTLADMNLNWRAITNQNHWSKYQELDVDWNDYREIDVVVAVRLFGSSEQFLHKPATKLYNAWLAGVPAVLGFESAFRSEGEPGSNYLEVTSLEELVQALARLKSDRNLRQKLVTCGRIEGQKFAASQTVQRWRFFLQEVATPAFVSWCGKPRHLQLLLLERNWLRYKLARATARISQLLTTS